MEQTQPANVDINRILKSLNNRNLKTKTKIPVMNVSVKKKSLNQVTIGNKKKTKSIKCNGKLVRINGKLEPKVNCKSSLKHYDNSQENPIQIFKIKSTARNNRGRNNSAGRANNNRRNSVFNSNNNNSNNRTSKKALTEIMSEIKKLRRNNNYFNSLKKKNRKHVLENMVLRNVLKKKKGSKKRRKFRIVEVPIHKQSQNKNNMPLDPELKRILATIKKHEKKGKNGKTSCSVKKFTHLHN